MKKCNLRHFFRRKKYFFTKNACMHDSLTISASQLKKESFYRQKSKSSAQNTTNAENTALLYIEKPHSRT